MVGTANFVNPTACIDIINGIKEYCLAHGIVRAADITGTLRLN
jgi:dihydroorotate dehydrogenase (NAD+) catalytic subunit